MGMLHHPPEIQFPMAITHKKIVRLSCSGLSYMYDEVFSVDPAEIISAVKERLNDQHLQKWRNELSSSSKMRTYRLFKLDFGMEQ